MPHDLTPKSQHSRTNTTTSTSSWKSNLFFIIATAAATIGLRMLYDRYRKKDQSTQTSSPTLETKTTQTQQESPITQQVSPTAKKPGGMLAHAEATKEKSSSPIAGILPSTGQARLFGSTNSYSVLPSRVASDEDLDKPKTPNNSDATITPEEQQKKGDRLFAAAAQAAEPKATGWFLWLSK